jgi:hypothetical protein
MSPKYSYVVLALSVGALGGVLAYVGGIGKLLEGFPFLLFLVSPFLVFSLAAMVAKRNIVIRFAVVLGCLFLVIDVVALFAAVEARGSTSAIGLGVLVFLQLLVAVPLLVASLVAGRVRLGRGTNGIV